MRTLVLVTAALAGVALTASAFAQSDRVCLQNNRIWSTSVVDDRTLIVNDRFNNSFVVGLSGGCQGLTTNWSRGISFNTRSRLGCLSPGDRVAFQDRIVGRNTCFVRDISDDLTTVAAGRGRPFTRVASVNTGNFGSNQRGSSFNRRKTAFN